MSLPDEDIDEHAEVERVEEFGRTNEKLGSGAFKIVYLGIDHERGIEVAWNQLRISQSQKYIQEIQLLQTFQHANIIKFYKSWIDKDGAIVFITEWMSTGTLKQFTKEKFRANQENLKPVKSWCRQILNGLNYLHTREPPIIHRDIKCDNIFIDATSGRVKIGDLGLAREVAGGEALSVIGTPEFMAPEFYLEHYNEKVDIWAFGMSVIEMVTGTTPYAGLNPVQIYKKVSDLSLPKEMSLIINPQLLEFVQLCFQDATKRPSAAELLAHPFLYRSPDDPPDFIDDEPSSILPPPTLISSPKKTIDHAQSEPFPTNPISAPNLSNLPITSPIVDRSISLPTPLSIDNSVPLSKILGRFYSSPASETNLALQLYFILPDDTEEKIEFIFDCTKDTAASVVSELVDAMGLPSTITEELTRLIQKAVEQKDFSYQKQ